jgi:hypothetical protein
MILAILLLTQLDVGRLALMLVTVALAATNWLWAVRQQRSSGTRIAKGGDSAPR